MQDESNDIDQFYETPQESYLKFHKNLCDVVRELSRVKQDDYCDLSDTTDQYSVFGNFMNPEKMGVADCQTVLMCRLIDKFTRLVNCTNKGECGVADEALDDTLMDMMNFLVLISYYRSLKTPDDGCPF
jgi:hypothetical protein